MFTLPPPILLQDPSYFDETEGLWMWKFEGNDMFMDIGEGAGGREVWMMKCGCG